MRIPIHPGEILGEELDELGLSATDLAGILAVPVAHITEILNGQERVTGEFAMRLSRWLGTSPQFWLNLQNSYELRLAAQTVGEEIERSITPRVGSPPEAA